MSSIHRFSATKRWRTQLVVAAGAAAAVALGAGVSLAATGGSTSSSGSIIRLCVNTKTRAVTQPTGTGTCPRGYFFERFNKNLTPVPGPAGPQGPTGPQGPAGPAGASAVTSISAATALENWPDTGGAGDVWGLDNFTRTLNVTVEDQVNNSHCNGAPVCYAVFGTISDVGTTVPQNGAAAPNNSEPATITAANITGISTQGQAGFQFYATSNKISAKTVPATVTGSQKSATINTTDWGELAFPAGTSFYDVSLTAYDWTYTAALSYTSSGTMVSCTQIWTDAINPGDDGQGSTDGNITGTCPTS